MSLIHYLHIRDSLKCIPFSVVMVLFVFSYLMLVSVEGVSQTPKLGNEWLLERATSHSKDDPQKSIELAEQVVDSTNSPLLKAQALSLLGNIAKKKKRYEDAEVYYKEAYDISLVVKDIGLSANSLRNIADAQRFTKKYDEALDYIQKAIDLTEEHELYSDLITAHNVKGNIYKSSKRNEESLDSFFDALSLVEKHGLEKLKSSAFSRIAKIYSRLDQLEKAIEYQSYALEAGERYGSEKPEQIVKYLVELSTYTRKVGDYRSALQYAQRALNLVSDIDSPKLKQRVLLTLTIIYRKLSVYDVSLKHAIDLRKSYEDHGNIEKVVTANLQIALIYDNLKQYDSAYEFFQRALDVPIEKSDIKYFASANRGKASILHKIGNSEESLRFAETARSLYIEINDRSGIEAADRLLGEINASLGKTRKARESFEKALSQSRALGASWSEANNLNLIGKLLVEVDPYQASTYVEQGVAIAKKIDSKKLVLDGYETMTRIAEKKNDFKSAYEYSLLAKDLSSEIHKEHISERIADLKIINEVDEKERKIELLRRKARIDKLELASQSSKIQLLDKKNAVSKLKLEDERYTRIFLIAVVGLVLTFLIVLFRLNQKSKQNITPSPAA